MLLNILLLAILFPLCISIDTITLNQSLTDNDVLLSKQRTFALGFFSPGNSRYKYVGIWYYKVPGQTVVWVANRNDPINASTGVLAISPDGNLVLYNNTIQKFPIWSTNVSLEVNETYVAQLLDSGNLVLFENKNNRIVWQSFDYPTDTILPGMKLGLDRKSGLERYLSSWRSADDPANGDYSFKINPTGSPQIFMYKGLNRYWRSNPWPWPGIVVPPTPKYVFVNNQDEVYYTFIIDDKSVFTRSVVNYTGLLQELTWSSSSHQWKESWSGPEYMYGHCGAYSINNGNSVDDFECTCLPGYEPKSLQDWYLRDGSDGCTRKRQQSTSMCRNGEGFVKVERLKIPDTSVAVLIDTSMSGNECEQLCLRNCSCLAFVILNIETKGVGCLTWHGELLDMMEYTEGRDLYVRVDAIELAENVKKTKGFFQKKGMLPLTILSVTLAMLLVIIFAYLWLRKKMKRKGKKKWIKKLFATSVAKELMESRQAPDLAFFNLGTIFAATNNFDPANKLGQGGFGSVYKGKLGDGQEIAVKRLSQSSGQGMEEFKTEVMLIARLQHRNLVKLLGCCIQGEERMLIYEYLPNRGLDSFIFDKSRRSLLDWRKRFDIIVGIARGVMYLHHDSRLRVVHRDLKTSNILLDADMKPKISDFGMARIFKGEEILDWTKRVVGTYGYMSPEYAVFGKFSTKSDVFSFGVILLEIISGKKSNTSYREDPSLNLIGHVWDLWREDRALEIVDSSLTGSCLPLEVFRCIHIGLLCVQEDAKDRPTMPAVVLMLSSETALSPPRQPAFIFRSSCNTSNLTTPGEGPSSVNETVIAEVEVC